MIRRIRTFFSDPARQALAWAALGIAGVAFAAAGLYLMTREESPSVEGYVPTAAVSPAASPSTPTTAIAASPSPAP